MSLLSCIIISAFSTSFKNVGTSHATISFFWSSGKQVFLTHMQYQADINPSWNQLQAKQYTVNSKDLS